MCSHNMILLQKENAQRTCEMEKRQSKKDFEVCEAEIVKL